ncbi:MAG: hypothetical protein KDB01_27735 [Planctomycetaceae bacterium]|nr:hypothetical protein [Planctomycetaceae bacterium]
MSFSLPTELDFDPFQCDLDAQRAWRNFGGLTLDEAHAKFEECPESYQEDFMFMGGMAFAFYYPVIERFLRKTIAIPADLRGDRQSWILPQCIKNQFEGPGNVDVRQLRDSVLELCAFMIENVGLFADDWNDVAEIENQWRDLRQLVVKSL